MQSLDWATLVTESTKHGFIEVLHLELICRTCGDWRVVFLPDSEPHMICPKCCAPVDFAVLGRGLTRALSDAICISPALPAAMKVDERPVARPEKQRGHRVMSRKRCERFFEIARKELSGVREGFFLDGNVQGDLRRRDAGERGNN